MTEFPRMRSHTKTIRLSVSQRYESVIVCIIAKKHCCMAVLGLFSEAEY